ncbi:hypothetical protein PG994_004118 [Apiospora phragmitis]|uniref:Uncharacterized protein n=1 Tax=Apiospora phragmitis TaxID=2905665 RepID=A0ABR1VTK1_9PEZI
MENMDNLDSLDIHELGRVLTEDRKPNGQFSPEAMAAIVALRVAGLPRKLIADAFGTPRVEAVNNLVRRFFQEKSPKPKKRSGRPRTRLSTRRQDRRGLGSQRRAQPHAEMQEKA